MEELFLEAAKAREKAYAPYSHYPVGAAVLAADGTVYSGCNVENASYGLTICAERVALSTAVKAGARSFKALAVVAGNEAPGMPCGACRQFMAEWFGPEVEILVRSSRGQERRLTFAELLPEPFGPQALREVE